MEKPPIIIISLWGKPTRHKAQEIQRDADLWWFVEWGNSVCPHHLDATDRMRERKDCGLCWLDLKKLAGGENGILH